MSKWFYFNAILLTIVIVQVITHFSFPALSLPVLFGFIGFLFFIFNWTRNAVFSTIRQHPDRLTKVKLARLSKKVMPFHRWTGTLALLFIGVHVTLIMNWYGFHWYSPKMVMGLLAFINLMAMVATGWIRWFKPTGSIRKIHLSLGFSLFIFITLHVLL